MMPLSDDNAHLVLIIVIHIIGSRDAGRVTTCDRDFVCVSVCLCVSVLRGKRLKLSTPNLVDEESMAVA